MGINLTYKGYKIDLCEGVEGAVCSHPDVLPEVAAGHWHAWDSLSSSAELHVLLLNRIGLDWTSVRVFGLRVAILSAHDPAEGKHFTTSTLCEAA